MTRILIGLLIIIGPILAFVFLLIQSSKKKRLRELNKITVKEPVRDTDVAVKKKPIEVPPKIQQQKVEETILKEPNRKDKPNKGGYLKIYASKVPNTGKSLDKKVAVSSFIDLVENQSYKENLLSKGYVNMWDFGVLASKHVKPGDTLWILTGSMLYEAELDFIINDEVGEIGDAIGWSRQFKGPWKNVAIFRSCKKYHCIPSWVYPYERGKKESIIKNFYKI